MPLEMKRALLARGLLASVSASRSQRPRITINRFAATAAVVAPSVGASTPVAVARAAAPAWAATLLGQAALQLAHVPASSLRQEATNPHLSFEVKLASEHVVGESGPYREFLTAVAAEAMGSHMPPATAATQATGDHATALVSARNAHSHVAAALFVPSPNALSTFGEHRDLMVPNPALAFNGDAVRRSASMSGVEAATLYQCLGVIIGCAIRTSVYLPLHLPSVVWKVIVGDVHPVPAARPADAVRMAEATLPTGRQASHSGATAPALTATAGAGGPPDTHSADGFDADSLRQALAAGVAENDVKAADAAVAGAAQHKPEGLPAPRAVHMQEGGSDDDGEGTSDDEQGADFHRIAAQRSGSPVASAWRDLWRRRVGRASAAFSAPPGHVVAFSPSLSQDAPGISLGDLNAIDHQLVHGLLAPLLIPAAARRTGRLRRPSDSDADTAPDGVAMAGSSAGDEGSVGAEAAAEGSHPTAAGTGGVRGLSKEEFETRFGDTLTFATSPPGDGDGAQALESAPHSPDGATAARAGPLEMFPGGAGVPVAYRDRALYAAWVQAVHTLPYLAAAHHIRCGIGSVVPLAALSLFSWREAEEVVCGRPDVDVDLLQRHTEFASFNAAARGAGPGASAAAAVAAATAGSLASLATAPHVNALWEALRGFTPQQRLLFARFVFGQDRLPSSDADWAGRGMRMLIKCTVAPGLPLPAAALRAAQRQAAAGMRAAGQSQPFSSGPSGALADSIARPPVPGVAAPPSPPRSLPAALPSGPQPQGSRSGLGLAADSGAAAAGAPTAPGSPSGVLGSVASLGASLALGSARALGTGLGSLLGAAASALGSHGGYDSTLMSQEYVDAQLPTADVCFGNLSLPAYSSVEILRERLLVAITLSSGLDADE
jgi:hypothetical protein